MENNLEIVFTYIAVLGLLAGLLGVAINAFAKSLFK